ncbi:alpha/beta fold hydrolase [Nocardioides aurantiacus]|uniref:Polyhydroxyalkanoate synthase n=1 Tax=Nocardioides aurantiacus TaxID=86796 RepID=A0A3N2CY63_9ACTN|nr:alpha/beta fold hydrolase [Nocardioides aurantiacus]ROR92470.1 polyhydroxyalkanoate synthase [Nocardioides aurantiacus]
MDLIPKPDQVASAASNVAHKLLYGGLADLRPMPRTLIDDGPLREVYHYRPHKTTRETGDPVLLVTPLAAPAICFDLRRGCSLVEHLVQQGRPTYLVEYGQISFKNRGLGIEHWVEEVIPEAVKAVSEHAGGRPVHLVGWSLGGIFATLVAADRPDLPIASLTVLGSPFDVEKVPLVAPLRPILRLTDGGVVTQLYRLLGGAPRPLVRRAFQLSSGTKLITKPLATLQHLDDTEWLAQIEAVDRFTRNMIAYPGRSFGQLYHRMLKDNQLLTGKVEVSGRDVDVADVTAPVLVFAGNTDGIAPINAVRALVGLLTKAHEVRFEIVPGGHLGMLTGRAARTTTWVVLDEWLEQYSTPDDRATRSKARARRKPRKRVATAGSAEPGTGAPAAERRTDPVAPDRSAIGSNPDRRFASASSRNLGRKP